MESTRIEALEAYFRLVTPKEDICKAEQYYVYYLYSTNSRNIALMPFKKGEIPQGAKPFQKGESGNPKGYTKGIPNRSTIARYVAGLPAKNLGDLAEYIPNDCDIATAGMFKLAHKLIFEGDVIAGRELYDSAYGKNADIRIDQPAVRKMVMIVTQGDIEDIEQELPQESV